MITPIGTNTVEHCSSHVRMELVAAKAWIGVLKLTFDLHINVNVRHSME